MKKFIAILALAGVAVFSAGCESKSGSGSSGATVTTVDAKDATCHELGSKYADLYDQAVTTLQGLTTYQIAANLSGIKALAQAAVDAGEKLESTCSSYFTADQNSALNDGVKAMQNIVDAI